MIDSKEEKARFAGLLTALADYYKQKLSAGVIGLYWEGLRQFDYEAIEKSAWAHTQRPDDDSHFMPRIGDLKKMMEGSTNDQGQIAWSKVDRAVRTVGPYADVAFDDPIIHRVIQEMGGWVHLCGKDDKEWPFTAKEFVTRYQSYKMTGETPEHAAYLTGIASSQNQHAGHAQPLEVRLLGNATKAKQVITAALPGVAQKQLNAPK